MICGYNIYLLPEFLLPQLRNLQLSLLWDEYLLWKKGPMKENIESINYFTLILTNLIQFRPDNHWCREKDDYSTQSFYWPCLPLMNPCPLMGNSEVNQSLAKKAKWAYQQWGLQDECPDSSNPARNMAKRNPKNHHEGKRGIIDISKVCNKTYKISYNLIE